MSVFARPGLIKKIYVYVGVGILICAVISPLFNTPKAYAAQLTRRKITATSSKISTSNTYAVSFRPALTTNILGIVVDFCTSPLVGTACTQPTSMATPADGATVNVTHNSQTNVGFTVHASSDQTGRVIITHATGLTSVITTDEVEFSLTVTNPSTTGTYYARLLTYSTTAAAGSYVPATPGTFIDSGGVAMSTANQLTITARVQEVLQFCVGTTLANAGTAQCSDMSGTSIDLGVVDSSAVSASSADAGKAMLRTNAVNGALVQFFAEQETSSGQLKVVGQTCSGSSLTDQCFNSSPSTQTSGATGAIVAGTEKFGMAVTAVNTTNGTTTNLTRDDDYTGDGTTGGTCNTGTNANCWGWNDTATPADLATATTVVDDELLEMKFAVTAAATTPTGQYTVTATFIAIGTF